MIDPEDYSSGLRFALEHLLLLNHRPATPAERLQSRARTAAEELDRHLRDEMQRAQLPTGFAEAVEELHTTLVNIAEGR